MAVHVDPLIPVHPITVSVLDRMVEAGILGEDDHVELLDGVLVEMSPQGDPHAYAIVVLTEHLVPAAWAAGLRLAPQCPLDVRSPVSQPEPDLAVVRTVASDHRPADAVLVVEVSVTSLRIDLGRKAEIYAAAGILEYWVLDIPARELVVHREPVGDRYESVQRLDEHATVEVIELDLAVPVAVLL